eukprot:scpid14907/ scgid35754/ ATP phosphoribosyltransferase
MENFSLTRDPEQLDGKLLFAIPKKGRLYEPSVALLQSCDLKYRRKHRLDVAGCLTLNVAFVFLPAADIPLYVSQGRVDLGITGQDVVAEAQVDVDEVLRLDFGKCRLCVQVPTASECQKAEDLAGKRVITSFPNLTRQFFKTKCPNGDAATVHFVSGSVEVACCLGLGEGIVDLVESGDTMRAAGLHAIDEIMKSEAVLIANKNSQHQDLVKVISSRVEGAIIAKRYVMVEYNLRREDLPKAIQVAPGKRSPTLAPLDDPDWVAVKVMVPNHDLGNILDSLKAVGALDIVVYNLSNTRP